MELAGGGYERACRLQNTAHSEIAPALSLPSLPPAFGSEDALIELSDQPGGAAAGGRRPDVLMQAPVIAELLRNCDVSYLNLKDNMREWSSDPLECSWLYQEVLKYNPEAFAFKCPGAFQEHSQGHKKRTFVENISNGFQAHGEHVSYSNDHARVGQSTPATSLKPKVKKKGRERVSLDSTGDAHEHDEDMIAKFCDVVDEFCVKAEHPDDMEGVEWSLLPLNDIKILVNEIIFIRPKKVLHEVPLNTSMRLLNVLDHQIRCAQGLSLDGSKYLDTDTSVSILSALESVHAALAVMSHHDMPKQVYREEIFERIIDFSRHQIMGCMAAYNPSYCELRKQTESDANDEYEDEEDIAYESSSKKRRNTRGITMRKSAATKASAAAHSVVQKLCLILGFLKEVLAVVRISDSCIVQLVKICFSTFLVDNMQLLQLKSIDLICAVFAAYTQHRNFLIEETLQLLRKLQYSKRAVRTFHLPDEEQKQIQMITALLVHLVQFTANPPDSLKKVVNWNTILDAGVDATYPIKCHEAAMEACCLFWTNVLQRLSAAKGQDISEARSILENLVTDLLATLNLPEYPASAPILEVLCVLLLQNAGLKSKDISARCLAVDLLGTVAARLKRDSVICNKESFWMLQELADANDVTSNGLKDACAVCLSGRHVDIVCQGCGRCFHSDCLGIGGQENLVRDWLCHICFFKKQLNVLQSYYKTQGKDSNRKNASAINHRAGVPKSVPLLEVIQQILLNYLQETDCQEDGNLFARWFYLCMWYKEYPMSQENVIYYLARLKSKEVLRDSGGSLPLSRDCVKKICLALGQRNSFSRGFDKILSLLLASLRENSPVLRAKALRAVSCIVEADPEALCDKRVQCAVEGRFCDSAISVREAALELVGRHIASHPDVGMKYFVKVAERIKDTGVSVRKRAIKIIRDLCAANPDFPEATHAFIEIISRVTDEESSVQDIVCKTFYELWFEEPGGSHKRYVADGSSIPLDIGNKTEQIVEMLRKMSNHQPLISVIKRILALDFLPQSAKASGASLASIHSVHNRCELICKCLLERILQVEEVTDREEDVHALPYVLALHAFCVVDSKLCVPASDPSQFVVTLQPYLKNQVDNKAIARLLESIIFIIDAVLPLLQKPPETFISELEQDLKNMIIRHSFLTVVHACIKCLCSLSKIARRGSRLVEYLVQIFCKHLINPTPDNKQLLGRSLFCLGLLLRYGYELMASDGSQCIDVMKILQLLKKYILMEDFALRIRALQALGYVMIAKPEFMLEKDISELLQASLSSHEESRLKIQGVQNLYEYLIDAEGQLSTEGTKSPKQFVQNGGSDVPVAAGAGDTNICGGIVQLYWNFILERCLDVSDQVRQISLKIVEVVLRQGLVHPITCVPQLIALETDPLEANAKLAHHLLTNMNEKYPSFFESRLGDGLQMSYRFFEVMVNSHSMVSETVKSNPIAFVKPGISRIYRLIRLNRLSRNKFIHSIVRKFETDNWNYSSLSFLIYCTEILASLPFTSPDEPLYLIYDINRVMQLKAGVVESNMKHWSSLSHQQDQMALQGYHNGTDESHNSCQTSTSEWTTMGLLNFSQDDLQKLQADYHNAVALQLLLKLKRHLKIAYSLNDARCQAFSLKEPPKSGEIISKQNIPLNIGNTGISLPTCYQDIVQAYQEFKTLMRDDSMDYVAYTAPTPRKRVTPKNLKGRKSKGEDHNGDDDYGVEWTSGTTVLNFGSPSNGGGRVTRQRPQR